MWGLCVVKQDSAASRLSAEPEAALKQQVSARSRVLPGSGDRAMDNREGDDADQDDEHLDKKMRDEAWVCADCSQVAIRS